MVIGKTRVGWPTEKGVTKAPFIVAIPALVGCFVKLPVPMLLATENGVQTFTRPLDKGFVLSIPTGYGGWRVQGTRRIMLHPARFRCT